jgi:Flp pilus assembly protein TadD
MPNSRPSQTVAIAGFAFLLTICLATNAYLAYRAVHPPRTLRVSIAFDPGNPPLPGVTAEDLKARVEALSSFFEKTAGIRLVVPGFTQVKLPQQTFDPESMRRLIDVRTPRDGADILVIFWVAPPGNPSLGSAPPYSSVAVVRFNPPDPKNAGEGQSRAILAHQILCLFGVPVSADPQSVMHVPPVALNLDATSAPYLQDARLFDFARGLGGMDRRMQARVLRSLERVSSAAGPQPGKKSAHEALGDLYLRDSLPAAAVAQFRSALQADPSNVAAHLGLSLALSQSGQPAQAVDEARAALKLAPNQPDAHYHLGYALVRTGNPEPAIAEFRQAIALQPSTIRYRTGLAVAYASSIGEFDQAEHEFQEALKIDPQNPALLTDIEFVHNLRARFSQQLQIAEAAVRANPASSAAHDRLAIFLLRLGQTSRALTEARLAVTLSPADWHPRYTLALVLYAAHDYGGSSAALAEAKRLGSGNRPFLEESLRGAANVRNSK